MAPKNSRRKAQNREVAARFKTWVDFHRLKPKDIVPAIPRGRNSIWQYTSGATRIPTAIAQALADHFGELDLNWLYTGRGRPPGKVRESGDTKVAERVAALEKRVEELERLPIFQEVQETLRKHEDRLADLAAIVEGNPDR